MAEQGYAESVAGQAGARFVFHSHPRCALTRAQERCFFLSVVALSLGTASVFAALGYWLVMPFAGLEIGLLAWALEMQRSRAHDFETLTIDGDAVLLEWRLGEACGRRELNRPWVSVVCECAAAGRSCCVSVRSHGRETVVGQYLSDEARLELAATLRSRLA